MKPGALEALRALLAAIDAEGGLTVWTHEAGSEVVYSHDVVEAMLEAREVLRAAGMLPPLDAVADLDSSPVVLTAEESARLDVLIDTAHPAGALKALLDAEAIAHRDIKPDNVIQEASR